MKTLNQIVDTRDKKEWGEFLALRMQQGERRPLMARGYRDYFGEKHETHLFHTNPNGTDK